MFEKLRAQVRDYIVGILTPPDDGGRFVTLEELIEEED